MKLITFTVPCYNSAAYMRRCVDALLAAGDEADILLVDDGSTDDTGAIADRYAAEHPGVVRVIHQQNGGHGEGVNQGILHAEGQYYMVVDSDDWLDEDALPQLLTRLRGFAQQITPVDLIVCNYVCEYAADCASHAVRFGGAMPEGVTFAWKDIGRLRANRFITIHSVVYRTEVLRRSGLMLPRHTFYVDNLYVYQPLPYVKTLFYLNIDLYHYSIGRDDQSATEENKIRHIDQQILVARLLIDACDLERIRRSCPKLADYMHRYLARLMLHCTIHLWLSGEPENIRRADALWDELKWSRPELYRRLRFGSCNICLLPGRTGRAIDLFLYRRLREKSRLQD